jgi:branched-chain amino acid transport system permease protein
MGWAPLLKGLVIMIFGGLGSVKGTVYASYILGFVEALSALYLGMFWSLAIFFLFMIVMLLIRPTGLYGMEEVKFK